MQLNKKMNSYQHSIHDQIKPLQGGKVCYNAYFTTIQECY